MFLKHAAKGELFEIMDLPALFDPFKDKVMGRFHAGEEMPDPEDMTKMDLVFPSGEALPQCWIDGSYKH